MRLFPSPIILLRPRVGRTTGISCLPFMHIRLRFGKSYIQPISLRDLTGSSGGSLRTSRPLPMMIPCAKCCIWRRQKLSNTGLLVVEIGIKSSASWTSYLATGLPGKSPPLICGSNHNLYAVFLSIGKSYLHKKFQPTWIKRIYVPIRIFICLVLFISTSIYKIWYSDLRSAT